MTGFSLGVGLADTDSDRRARLTASMGSAPMRPKGSARSFASDAGTAPASIAARASSTTPQTPGSHANAHNDTGRATVSVTTAAKASGAAKARVWVPAVDQASSHWLGGRAASRHPSPRLVQLHSKTSAGSPAGRATSRVASVDAPGATSGGSSNTVTTWTPSISEVSSGMPSQAIQSANHITTPHGGRRPG